MVFCTLKIQIHVVIGLQVFRLVVAQQALQERKVLQGIQVLQDMVILALQEALEPQDLQGLQEVQGLQDMVILVILEPQDLQDLQV